MKNSFIVLLILFLSLRSLWSKEITNFELPIYNKDEIFSLKEAQSFALENNYAVNNSEIDAEIAVKKIWETTASGLPQIDGEVKYNNFLELGKSVIPARAFNPNAPEDEFVAVAFGTEQNITAGVTASQLLFSGTYFVGLQAAKVYALLAQQSVMKSEDDTKNAVADAYYMAVVARENTNLLQENLKNLEQSLYEIEEMYKAGFVEKLDKDQMELTVSNLKINIEKATRQAEMALDMLKFQMGMKLSEGLQLSEGFDQLLKKDMLEQQPASFEASSNINYQLLQTQKELNELNVKAEYSRYLPTASAFLSHSRSSFANEFKFFNSDQPWYPQTLFGININIPIWSSGLSGARVKQAKLEVLKIKNQQEQLKQSLKLEYQSAVSNYRTALQVYINAKENLALAEEITEVTNAKYVEGLASSMDLTQAQNQYLNTQGNYINAMFELLKAKSELDKLLNKY